MNENTKNMLIAAALSLIMTALLLAVIYAYVRRAAREL